METKRIPFQYLVISAKLNNQRLNNLEVKEPTGERPEIKQSPFSCPALHTYTCTHVHTQGHARTHLHKHERPGDMKVLGKFWKRWDVQICEKWNQNQSEFRWDRSTTYISSPSMASKCLYYFFIMPVRNYYLAFWQEPKVWWESELGQVSLYIQNAFLLSLHPTISTHCSYTGWKCNACRTPCPTGPKENQNANMKPDHLGAMRTGHVPWLRVSVSSPPHQQGWKSCFQRQWFFISLALVSTGSPPGLLIPSTHSGSQLGQ